MEGKGYFFKITGAFIVGVLSLLASIAVVLTFWDQVSAALRSILAQIVVPVLILIAIVIVWTLIYAFTMFCIGIYISVTKPKKEAKAAEAPAERPTAPKAPKAPAKKRRGKARKKK